MPLGAPVAATAPVSRMRCGTLGTLWLPLLQKSKRSGRLRELLRAHDLDADKGPFTFDPGVVPRWDSLGLARLGCLLRAITHSHRNAAGHNMTNMTHLTAVSAYYWFDALRPPPSGLQLKASDREAR